MITLDKLNIPGIAFCGPIGSGKTTMATALNQMYMGKTGVVSFADALRYQAAEALHAIDTDVPIREFIGAFTSVQTKDRYRPFLQWLGTEYRRGQDPEYWVRKLTTWVDRSSDYIWLIDDCRFPNEYFALRSRGFMFVCLHPDHTTGSDRPTHDSELYWPDFDYDIILERVQPISARVELFHKLLTKYITGS